MATAGGGRETAGTHLDDAVAVARRLSNVQWVHVRPPRPWQTHAPPPAPPPPRSVRGETRPGRGDPPPSSPCPSQQGVAQKRKAAGCRTANDTPAGVPASRRPAAAPPPPRRRGGEQPGKRIKQRVGGRRRPRHRLGHTHPTRPPRPTLSPLRCVTVAPERGGGADERQRGGEGHTQRQWTIRAGRGAPPADDARFLAGGCGGQQTLAGRPQQRAPVWPTPTTTRPSSRNWPTRPAPTVVRRCGIGSPLPRTAGRPADATGGGGGAGYNVCAPGGEPWVTRHALPYQKGRPRQRRPSSTSQSAPAQRPRRRGAVAAPRCRRPARPCRPVRSGNVGSGGGGRRRKSRLASHAPRDGRLQARPTDGGARRASCVGQTVRERRRRKGSPRMTPPYRTAPCAGVGGAVATRVADGRTHRRGCGCRRHREGRRGPLGLIQSAGMRRLDRRRTVYVFLCFWRVGEEWVVW